MRILLVEDDRDLGPVLALGLRNEAYAVDLAQNYAEAEALLCSNDFDVACLDLGLPDGDGLELLRRLGADPALRRPRRLLVLTARDAVDDRVAGLDAGADDYLVKPFSFQELAARLRALARRADVRDAVLTVGDLRLDAAAHRAWRGGAELDLTPREFSMLRYLMHHPGRTVSAEELLEHVWDANADPFTASVRVILSRLRRKLGEPGPISTVNGVGYVLRAAP
ncbi:response regulator transcription factor [Glycomyces algeriensis]|uniref:Transcriptional regulatory protein CutR n=1 Tax=Glycomyces algeriensis TaxID=256037 RepID=A0A9W6G9I3_9ACTN|nr:response regulator transcription factor [Glycomyces algeriensis]MDA1364936.1 response regulator transcription factor [Glycomyces algeriensis]MDR7350003.1 DNA-binding response OmpR family regulator [Glycomyces algeriensis]GLI42714.1 transcriptional regulatory protein CutR [Glycomyces algeriensis]